MKKGFKLTMASALAVSALTPVAAFANETETPAKTGFYTADSFLTPVQFKALSLEEKRELLAKEDLVLVTDGKVYIAKDAVGKSDEVLAEIAIEEAEFEAEFGELTESGYNPGEVAPDLTVETVSAITATGVEVTFEATTADDEEANVVVKDGEGNVVPTEATLVAEGSTSAEFLFTTPFEMDDFTGVWTVNGVEFSFDAINQLADILAAVADGNEIALQDALDAAGITYADEAKIGDYLAALDSEGLTEEDTLADVQDVIDGVDEDDATAEANAAKVKAVVDAATQKQLLDALKSNFELVNSEWIVDYAEELVDGTAMLELTEVTGVTVSDIQDAVDQVNSDAIDAADVAADTAAKQVAVTALIETWMKADDAETPEVTPKADAIEASKVKEAAFKVAEAKTANTLYNTLVSYANLVEDDSLKASDLNASNKSFYFAALEAEDVRTDLVAAIKVGSDDIKTTIVDAGNLAAAGSAIVAITGADSADKLLAALKSLGLNDVVDANKDAYYVTDNANFSAVENKDEAQGVVDAINDAEEFKTTYATVLDLTTEDVVADDLADVKAAVKAFADLSDAADAFLETEEALLGSLETAVEGKFLADVNLIAGEGNMSEKLDVLGNSFYSKLTVEQKKEVAKLFIVTNDTENADGYTDFATFDQIQPALNTAIVTYKALLDEVNAAETKAAMKVAIGKVATAAGISPTDTELTLMADIAFDQKPEAGYKTVAEILSVIQ